MSRWFVVLPLSLGIILSGAWWSAPAAAQDGKAAPFPTKGMIREAIEKEQFAEAEQAYLSWSSYWQEEDAPMLARIAQGILMNEFRDGKNAALVALAQAGDREALNVLTAQVLSDGNSWPSADLIPAIRFIGESGDRSALNVLRSLLFNDDPAVVNATIEALGDVGDARVAGELTKLFDEADPERSVLLARTLARLGQAKAVQARFEPQLKFPLPGIREKAALVLAALGNQVGWPLLHNMLQAKEAPYYPLVVTVLGALPTQESLAFVSAALNGKEAPEQLAALQSINVLPADKLVATLLGIVRDTDRPVSVRIQAIRLLGTRVPPAAAKEMRLLATNLAEGDAEVKAEAMMTLKAFGLLANPGVREVVRQRIRSEEEPVARAARAVLLSYALTQEK